MKCSSPRKGKEALGAPISFALIIQNVAFHSQWCKYITLVRNQGEQGPQSRSRPAGISGEEKQKLCCIRYWRTSKYFYSLLLFLCEREQPSRFGWLALGRDFGKLQSKSMFECMCVHMCAWCLHEVQNVQFFICYCSHLHVLLSPVSATRLLFRHMTFNFQAYQYFQTGTHWIDLFLIETHVKISNEMIKGYFSTEFLCENMKAFLLHQLG